MAELEGEERARPVVAHLLLETAYGAAQTNQQADAITLWEHARSLVARGPAVAAWIDHPGPMRTDQVERYGLCIQHLLGNTRRAIHHMTAIDPNAVPTAERAARVRHDSAKLYRDLGDLQSALRLLRKQKA
ncbi:hypothetical protein [Streptomyces daliensis]|uniref:Uncharacterized protein n=1 Tax=Streptomyces daliensis TaxID=299421 RepID=A0A8T4ISP0_9ACTN|nr:hypothetical protein [Streptomyces daliensis]